MKNLATIKENQLTLDDIDDLDLAMIDIKSCTDAEVRRDFEGLILYARQIQDEEPGSLLYEAVYDACYLYASELSLLGLPINTH